MIAAQDRITGKDQLIVALDVPDVGDARALIAELEGSVGVYKIGLELLFSGGIDLARELSAAGSKVFIDAKLLDIETTVERAVANIARIGATFLTIHATDEKTMRAAVRGKGDAPLKLLGVTVLTNLGPGDLKQQGIEFPPADLVLRRAKLAKETGLDGVVASGREAANIREASGPGFLIVTPGIRSSGSAADDQTRSTTPAEAIAAGADYLVVGRPITRAPNPRVAAEAIVAEIAAATRNLCR